MPIVAYVYMAFLGLIGCLAVGLCLTIIVVCWWLIIESKLVINMKKIKVTLTRSTIVEVLIDENIITEDCLNGIQQSFDEDIFEEPEYIENECSRYECGLYNYAKAAAMTKIDLPAEYITLDQPHTSAKILSDYLESEFYEIEVVE